MRTTVTLESDVELLVTQAMRERGLTFKQAVNEAIRAGMTPARSGEAPTFPTHDMGDALIDVTKALQIAGELEDQELARKLPAGK